MRLPILLGSNGVSFDCEFKAPKFYYFGEKPLLRHFKILILCNVSEKMTSTKVIYYLQKTTLWERIHGVNILQVWY